VTVKPIKKKTAKAQSTQETEDGIAIEKTKSAGKVDVTVKPARKKTAKAQSIQEAAGGLTGKVDVAVRPVKETSKKTKETGEGIAVEKTNSAGKKENKQAGISKETNSEKTPETKPQKENDLAIATSSINPEPAFSTPGDSVKRKETEPITETGITKKDSIMPLPKKDSSGIANKEEKEPEEEPVRNIISVELGADYLLGWNGGKQEANGFNPAGGINYIRFLTPKIGVGIGAHYSSINNLTNSVYTIENRTYDFGVETDVLNVEFKKLQYITFPLKFYFKAGSKNLFGAGLHSSILFAANGNMESYKTSDLDPVTHQNAEEKKVKEYMEGFKSYDLRISAFYRRYLIKDFSVGFEFFFGLTDVKNNSFFQSTTIERNTGLRVSLNYDLFKK
jgi:hypothetical protein